MTNEAKILKRALEMAVLAWHKNDCQNCLPFNINDEGEFECGIDDRKNCIKRCAEYFIRKAKESICPK